MANRWLGGCGAALPGKYRIEVCAGRSTQATLLGRGETTYELLYLYIVSSSVAILMVGVNRA